MEHGGLGPILGGRAVEARLEGGGCELLPVVGPGVHLGRGGGALVNAETAPLGQGRGRGGLRGGEGVWLTNEGSRGSGNNISDFECDLNYAKRACQLLCKNEEIWTCEYRFVSGTPHPNPLMSARQ